MKSWTLSKPLGSKTELLQIAPEICVNLKPLSVGLGNVGGLDIPLPQGMTFVYGWVNCGGGGEACHQVWKEDGEML